MKEGFNKNQESLNNRCYASSLNNCSGKVTREHYISSGILNLIGNRLQTKGFSWLKGSVKNLCSKALTSNILCEHHNNVLSELDDTAISFFSTLQRFDKELGINNLTKNEKQIFSGHMIERWFVKLYLGLHWGGHLDSKLSHVEFYLLENLFLDKRLPNHFGLYFGSSLGTKMTTYNGLSITTYTSQTMDVCAMTCEIVGFPFHMSIRPGKLGGVGLIDAPAQYHPIGIVFKNHDHSVSKEITFTW